jgi:hypothetical protein
MSVGGGAVAVWRLDRLTRPAENFEASLFVPTPRRRAASRVSGRASENRCPGRAILPPIPQLLR